MDDRFDLKLETFAGIVDGEPLGVYGVGLVFELPTIEKKTQEGQLFSFEAKRRPCLGGALHLQS